MLSILAWRFSTDLLKILFSCQYFRTSSSISGNETLDLATLLPSDQSKYYSYLGSLTTPNYAEHSDIPNAGPITWILLKNKQKISRTNLDTYRNKYTENNVRTIRPLLCRRVYEKN